MPDDLSCFFALGFLACSLLTGEPAAAQSLDHSLVVERADSLVGDRSFIVLPLRGVAKSDHRPGFRLPVASGRHAQPNSAAETSRRPRGAWVGAGGGIGSIGGSGILMLSYRSEPHVVTARVAATVENTGGSEPGESVLDIGLLYGGRLQATSDWFLLSGSIGVAFVSVERPELVGFNRGCISFCDSGPIYDENTTATVGLPVQVRLAAQGGVFGLGVVLFGNVNSEQSFAGAGLILQIGRLR